MTNIILFDDKDTWTDLLPIVYTRPISDIRIGILTIKEKWQKYFPDHDFSCLTAEYLSVKYPTNITDDNLFIAGNCCPDKNFADAVSVLGNGEALAYNGELVAYRGTMEGFKSVNLEKAAPYTASSLTMLHQLYDIFLLNGSEMRRDYHIIIAGRESQPLSETCTIVGPYRLDDGCPAIFIEEGATVEAVTLNTTGGPIYIGKDAVIMEGVCIRAPFAACRHSQVNMGAKIYGATTLGPYCKVGGELNNVVMIGYSNKAHDGFLGNAVIGEWCNIGAGTNASNLKNDYTEIKLWNYRAHRFLRTGLQFCGLIMGDHSKAGINCMFNTATVIGVGVNVHGAGFPRNFVASFSEGSVAGYTDVSVVKFFDIAKRMMARRGIELSETDKEIFESIYRIAENYK
ncbi:MAG: glucose-1-phosphate thymidylyltransferase [Bacteroidetes bacterium]|uniref:Glucose-1-phosphate thymidylyltransferase n=1 Tax=Candidatus Limisoma faecipullorum TaxID=2840854 RepID=A0A9D9IQJ7_9BACT|nr:glucose-1-phosphate thymidylyltransferase [Candidatus Limisoma faecipullorum]